MLTRGTILVNWSPVKLSQIKKRHCGEGHISRRRGGYYLGPPFSKTNWGRVPLFIYFYMFIALRYG